MVFMKKDNERIFAEYDYMEVTAKNKYEALYRESYPQFGWEPEGSSDAELEMNAVTLKFRRSRKIPNKIELTRLQRQFENAMKEIAWLEKNTPFSAIAAVAIIGLIGAGLLIGAVFSFFGVLLLLAIILTALGCTAWSISCIVFILLRKRKIKLNKPKIAEQYNEINELVGQAENLLKK